MPSIRVVVEIDEGTRAEFERETMNLVSGDGTFINGPQLRSLWQSISGEVSHWIRYREPTEAKAE